MTKFLPLFTYTACLAMILPLFFPSWHILYFAPFLILCFYDYSLVGCLWWSLICGFIIDLFSAETRLGIYAFNYCATTFFLYRYQFHFFEDRLSTLPAMSFCFTCLSTILQIVILSITGKNISLSWDWLISDLLLIPLQVSIYSILAFTLPFMAIRFLKRRYLLFRLKRRRP